MLGTCKSLAMIDFYTPQPQDPLQTSDITFTNKFHGSVPHRVRNTMRELSSKSYSLDIDKEIIKGQQKTDPTFRNLYNFFKFKHIPLQRHVYRRVINQAEHFDLIDDILHNCLFILHYMTQGNPISELSYLRA